MPETLAELYSQYSDCTRCSLSKSANHVVFGFGNEKSEVVFVGEAPGYHEDKEGKPFVGAAGQLLTNLLKSIGINRDDIYITNVLKCRPPGNRDPLPEEIEACKPLLMKQLEIIAPKVVVTLGSFAARVILGKVMPMSKIHGQTVKADGFTVFPTYHPAAALYARTTMTSLEEDFKALKELMDSGVPQAKQEAKAEQLGLF